MRAGAAVSQGKRVRVRRPAGWALAAPQHRQDRARACNMRGLPRVGRKPRSRDHEAFRYRNDLAARSTAVRNHRPRGERTELDRPQQCERCAAARDLRALHPGAGGRTRRRGSRPGHLRPETRLRHPHGSGPRGCRRRFPGAARGRAGPARPPGPADPAVCRGGTEGLLGTEPQAHAVLLRPARGAVPGLSLAARSAGGEGAVSGRAGAPQQVHRPRAGLRADHQPRAGPHDRALRGRRPDRAVDGRGRAGPGEPASVRRRHP